METTKYIVNNLTGQTINGASILLEYEVCTYSELYNKTINSELTPGQWYKVTDYRSVNFLNGWQIADNNPTPVVPSFNPREVVIGDETEVLLLQAISSYEISPIGYSETFTQDIVTYLPLVNKIGVNLNISNGYTMPDSSVVSGFDLEWDGTNVYFNMPTGYPAHYGHYFYVYCEFQGETTYYQGGVYEPLSPNGICQYPSIGIYNQEKTMSRIKLENGGTKVVLLDLVEQDYLNYQTDTLYVEHIEALNDAYGWVTRRQDTQNRIDVPFDFRWIKYRRYECEVLGDITSVSYTATGTTAADNTYNNLSSNSDTSVDGQNATFNVTVISGMVTNVVIKNKGRLYANGDTLTIDGTQIGGVTIDDDVVITVDSINSNIGYWGIGDVFNGANTTGTNNYIDSLSIDWTKWSNNNLEIDGQGGPDASYFNGYCENNVFLGVVTDCKIGTYFLSNTIGNDFYYNTIGNEFNNNTIGNYFNYNTIGGNYNNNTIGNDFNKNTIRNGFQTNSIGTLFQYNTIGNDFTSNIIGDSFDTNTIGDTFYSNTIGNGFINNFIKTQFGQTTIGDNFEKNSFGDNTNSNTIGDNFTNNTIGNNFTSNTIGNDLSNNAIGNYFLSNTIGNDFGNNTIGSYFYNNTIGDNLYNNTIGNTFNGNTIGNNFSNNAIGNDLYNNTIGNTFLNNTIGHSFGNNTIGNDFLSNTIGNNFTNNTIGNYFQYNTIGNNFYINTISEYFAYNKIGNYFNNNTIGDGFGFGYSTSQGNIIGNYFYQNTIGEYFYNNEIADGFYSNTIVDYFQLNKIKVSVSNIDFTLATHVYEYYNCEIFRKSNNELRLSLIDGLDSLFIREIDN